MHDYTSPALSKMGIALGMNSNSVFNEIYQALVECDKNKIQSTRVNDFNKCETEQF